MSQRCIRPLRERAAPILEVLATHFPNLSEEASVAFAVQIVLANERGDDRNSLLHHLFGSRSSNQSSGTPPNWPMADHHPDEALRASEALRAAVQRNGLIFIRTELQVVETMLRLIRSNEDEGSRPRRLAIAGEACAEAERYLDLATLQTPQNQSERDELAADLQLARQRLDTEILSARPR